MPVQRVEQALLDPGLGRPVRMLRIERQRDAERAAWSGGCTGVYFSTPLTTMPRVKNRWKTRKITIGMTIVISVPAWMNAWLR